MTEFLYMIAPWHLFLFGLCVGSFLNVVIGRIPYGDSIVLPGSRCPNCFQQIHWYQNIPVASWIALGRRCAHCHIGIPVRYPAVELGIGITYAVLWQVSQSPLQFLIASYLVTVLTALSAIDLDHFILPDILTYQLAIVGIGLQYFVLHRQPVDLVVDVLVGPGLLLAVRQIYWLVRGVEGLGLGDVKLMAGVGAFLAAPGAMFTLIVGSFLGAIAGIGAIILGKEGGMQKSLPFGPFLSLAAIIWVFWSLTGTPEQTLRTILRFH